MLLYFPPGCRHASCALAWGLHDSEGLATESACPERVTVLLALAFPGQFLLPQPILGTSVSATTTTATTGFKSEATVATRAGGETRFRAFAVGDRQTRENALSCLCSISEVILSFVDGLVVYHSVPR